MGNVRKRGEEADECYITSTRQNAFVVIWGAVRNPAKQLLGLADVTGLCNFTSQRRVYYNIPLMEIGGYIRTM